MCQVTVVDHALQPLTFVRMYNSNNSCEEKGLGLYPGWVSVSLAIFNIVFLGFRESRRC